MSTETTEKKTRTPRNAEAILAGALSLELKDRVYLVQQIRASIESEVAAKAKEAEDAKAIVNGSLL